MPYFAGLDVSKETTAIAIVDGRGERTDETVVPTEVKAIRDYLVSRHRRYGAIGVEASTLSNHLCSGLALAKVRVTCIEAQDAHDELKRTRNKTDRNDARGIAEAMRANRFRVVHIKSADTERIRSLIVVRRILLEKATDIQRAIGGLLLTLGLKLEPSKPATFETRVRALAHDGGILGAVEPLLHARAALLKERAAVEARLEAFAASNETCRLLRTAPGVGWLTALVFMTAIDDPRRFAHSRDVGPYLGLVPAVKQSGKRVRIGHLTKAGNPYARRTLYMAAQSILVARRIRPQLREWGLRLAQRRGRRKACAALARRLAIILHRMWMSGETFRWEGEPSASAG